MQSSTRVVPPELRSLACSPDFRRLFAGRVVSVAGDVLYSVAALWLVYELTGSAFYTGLAGFLTRVPAAFRFLVGPFVDRWPLRRTLVGSELAQAALVVAVPLAAANGRPPLWLVLGVMPLLAAVGLFAGPAQSATLPRIVSTERLAGANSAFSSAPQAVRGGAYAAGGALVAFLGAPALYLLDAGTFVLAALLLAGLTVRDRAEGSEGGTAGPSHADDGVSRGAGGATDRYRHELREGWRVVVGSSLAPIVLAAGVATSLGAFRLAVLPAYADGVAGPEAYGLVLAAMFVGSVLGSLVTTRFDGVRLPVVASVGFLCTGLAWLGAVLASSLAPTLVLFVATFVPVGVYNVLVSTVLQTGVPDDRLGRVSALVGSLAGVAAPVGTLLGGLLESAAGTRTAMLVPGAGYLLISLFWALSPRLRLFPAVTDVQDGAFGSDPTSPT